MTSNDMLLGELKEFKAHTVKELAEIKKEVKNLNSFKWKAMGVMSGIVIIFEGLVTYMRFK